MIIQVALPVPVRGTFDYRSPPEGNSELLPGMRVLVPFGKKRLVGLCMKIDGASRVAAKRLRSALETIDQQPLLAPEHLRLLEWASRYYHHPIGEVVFQSLPPTLATKGKILERDETTRRYRIKAGTTLNQLRGSQQVSLYGWLSDYPDGVSLIDVCSVNDKWRAALRALERKEIIECCNVDNEYNADESRTLPACQQRLELNSAQNTAVGSVNECLGTFQPLLLDGVTGSGKTEVYLRSVEAALAQGKQALVLVPEIGLTGQTLQRFRETFAAKLAVLHSALTPGARMRAWEEARQGRASIVIGTRSAVWTPMPNLGLMIVDEEHDLSYKQQDGFRYSARDVAVLRAKRSHCPVVLGSATPSLESLLGVHQGRYRHVLLPERVADSKLPSVHVFDTKNVRLRGGMASHTFDLIAERLSRGEQSLVFLNRRGYAPVVICHACGWSASCQYCDAKLVYHRALGLLRCHHCGAEVVHRSRCEQCASSDLRSLGQGTERLDQVLRKRFPDARIARIDRDSTRRRGELDALIASVVEGTTDIVIGTQMVAKGHHFPNVTLVVVVDGDSGLYSVDFRAGERMAQQLIQVMGRAGRGQLPGTVVIQTHCPNHPLLDLMRGGGYAATAAKLMAERRATRLPPYRAMCLLRAEALRADLAEAFLKAAKQSLIAVETGLDVYGPAPALMERKAGRYRWQLIVQSVRRTHLQAVLERWVPLLDGARTGRSVRWSLDVDPQDMA